MFWPKRRRLTCGLRILSHKSRSRSRSRSIELKVWVVAQAVKRLVDIAAYPLVEKLEIFFATWWSNIYPSFISGGGTADHLTGSLLTNWWFLETVLCPDFSSNPYFLRYESLTWLWRHGLSLHNAAAWIRDLCSVLGIKNSFHDWNWYSLIWFVWLCILVLM